MRIRPVLSVAVFALFAVAVRPAAAQAPPPATQERLAQTPLPADARYTVHRATAGSQVALLAGEDAAWRGAEAIAWGSAPYETRFRALWAPEGLYLRWDADDPAPWHTMKNRDDKIWNEEVVEVFLDPAWAGKDYWELEISPANVVCDVRMKAPHPNVTSDLSWNHEGLQTAVRHERNADGTPHRWVATALAPWAGFRSLPIPDRVALPPAVGDAWGFNAFRIERPNGPDRPTDGAVNRAWSPTSVPSFHSPAAFRKFVFAAR